MTAPSNSQGRLDLQPLFAHLGQTRATIYKTPAKGCDSFTVAWYEGAKRLRKVFADLEAAETHATSKVNSLSVGEAQIINLSGPERLAYIRAREMVAEFGLALDSAAVEYRDAKRCFVGVPCSKRRGITRCTACTTFPTRRSARSSPRC